MTSELIFKMDNKDKMIREIDNKRIFGVIEIDIIKLEKEFSRLKKLNAVKTINKIRTQFLNNNLNYEKIDFLINKLIECYQILKEIKGDDIN